MIEYKLVNKSDFAFDSKHVNNLNPSEKLKDKIDDLEKDLKITLEITYQDGHYLLTYESNDKEIQGGTTLESSPNEIVNANALSNSLITIDSQIFASLSEVKVDSKLDEKEHKEPAKVVDTDEFNVPQGVSSPVEVKELSKKVKK